MTDDQGELPNNPFRPYDTERIAKEMGGVILATIERGNHARLTIGAFEHPHKIRSLNVVTIRMYLDGKQTGAIDLDISDVDAIFTALGQAVHICWPAPPDPPAEPRTDWSVPPPDEDGEEDQDET